MKRSTLKLLVLFNLLFTGVTFAQVGINTSEPQATLDILSTGNTASTKSMRISNSDNNETVTVTDQGRVGIGKTVPEGQLHISTTSANGIISERSAVGNVLPTYLNLRKNRSTDPNVNGAVQNQEVIGAVTFSGNTGNGYVGLPLNSNSSISVKAEENFTDIAQGSSMEFKTVPIGTAANATRMIITDAGRVGMGTTLPSSILHVQYNDPTGITAERFSVNDGPSYLNLQKNRSTDSNVNTAILSNDGIGQINFMGNSGSGYEGSIRNSYPAIEVKAAEDFTATAQGSNMLFKTVANGTATNATRMTITDQGRVGIGKTVPEGQLHVSTTSVNGIISERSAVGNVLPTYLNLRKNRSTDPNVNGAVQNQEVIGAVTFSGNTGNGYVGLPLNSNSSITVKAEENFTDVAQGSSMEFKTVPIGTATNATRMTITDAGRIGMGTTLPQSALHLSYTDPTGIIAERSSVNDAPSYINLRKNRSTNPDVNGALLANDLIGMINFQGNTGNGYVGSIRSDYSSIVVSAAENFTNTAQGSNMMFNTVPTGSVTSSTRMTITNQGSVGVGTTTPQGQLHIVSTFANGLISERTSTSPTGPSYLALRRNRGTNPALNGAVLSGDMLGVITFNGNTGSGYEGDPLNTNAGIQSYATENFTTNNQGSNLIFLTRSNGAVLSSTRMTISHDGLVGLGRTPVTNRLEVNGEASKNTAGAFIANSDARLKKDIKPISGEEALSKLIKLEGVTYYWNDNKTGIDRPKEKQIGFIAQNIQKVFPEKVKTDNQGYLQTAYGDYDAIFVESIKLLNNKIIELTNRLEKLEKENKFLKQNK